MADPLLDCEQCPHVVFKTQELYLTKKCITLQVFEPSELERGHFTEIDNAIRAADFPERFQVSELKFHTVANMTAMV